MSETGWPFLLETFAVDSAQREWMVWPDDAVKLGIESPDSDRTGLGTCKANQWFAMTHTALDNGETCTSASAEDCYFCHNDDWDSDTEKQYCPKVTRCHIYDHGRRGLVCRGIRVDESIPGGLRDKCIFGDESTPFMPPPPPPAPIFRVIASTGLVERIMSILHLGSLRVVTMHWDSTEHRIFSLEYKFIISRTEGELEAILVRDNVGWSDRAAQRDDEAVQTQAFIHSIASDHTLRSTTRFHFVRSGEALGIVQRRANRGIGEQYELDVAIWFNNRAVTVQDGRQVLNPDRKGQLFFETTIIMDHYGDEAYSYTPSGANIHNLLKEATVITQPLLYVPSHSTHVMGAGFVQVVDGTVGYGEGAFDNLNVGGDDRPDLDLIHGEAFDVEFGVGKFVYSWQQDTYAKQSNLRYETLIEWQNQLFSPPPDSVMGLSNVVGGLQRSDQSYTYSRWPPEYDYDSPPPPPGVGFDYERTLNMGTPIRSFSRTSRNGEHIWKTYAPPPITRQVAMRGTLHWQHSLLDINDNLVPHNFEASWYDANRIAYLSTWIDRSGGFHISRLSSGPHPCFDENSWTRSAPCEGITPGETP
jgi:hypothetical protein